MRVEIDFQRAEAIQLIQAVNGQQSEKVEKCVLALFTYAENWDKNNTKNTQFSMLSRKYQDPTFSSLLRNSVMF